MSLSFMKIIIKDIKKMIKNKFRHQEENEVNLYKNQSFKVETKLTFKE